mmetsp:Transcript_11331/g.22090  ORF Transcript_11331/g.22090 Transcript_11331/m.22090 type:complete len:205 (-) Transcript_11331:860-1474(-)
MTTFNSPPMLKLRKSLTKRSPSSVEKHHSHVRRSTPLMRKAVFVRKHSRSSHPWVLTLSSPSSAATDLLACSSQNSIRLVEQVSLSLLTMSQSTTTLREAPPARSLRTTKMASASTASLTYSTSTHGGPNGCKHASPELQWSPYLGSQAVAISRMELGTTIVAILLSTLIKSATMKTEIASLLVASLFNAMMMSSATSSLSTFS